MNDFEPTVSGTPNPKMSTEEYGRIIADARKNYQNVYFGNAWMDEDQMRAAIIYAAVAPVRTSWKALVASVAGWLGI